MTDAYFERKLLAARKNMLAIAWKILHNADDGEEAVSEASMRAWKARHKSDPTKFEWYCYAAARSCAIDKLRLRATYRECRKPICLEFPVFVDTANLDPISHPPTDVESAAINRLFAASIMASMPDDLQHLFAERFEQGKTMDQISRETGIQPGTIKSRIYRAMERIASAQPEQL
jgi:RNA polymerase sigma factor (sigma-70 family)